MWKKRQAAQRLPAPARGGVAAGRGGVCIFYAKASYKNKTKQEKPESFNPEHELHESHEFSSVPLFPFFYS